MTLSKDLTAGLILTAIGGALFYQALGLQFGSPTDMGAGFLPRVAAGALFVIGLGFLAGGLRRNQERVGHMGWRAMAFVTAAILCFALVMPRVGLVAGAIGLVVLTSLAGKEFRYREVAVLAIGLCLLAVTLFVKMLGLPMKV